MERKLTTIFASDVVGFSKMMGLNELKTLQILNLSALGCFLHPTPLIQ